MSVGSDTDVIITKFQPAASAKHSLGPEATQIDGNGDKLHLHLCMNT